MRFFLLLLLLGLPRLGAAQAPNAANKALFDRTVDELNFRTFEAVYDRHFTRQKFPPTLRTAAARRQFADFEGNAELQKLFANYNGVAERFKSRFGRGPLTQAEFEKQLNSVLIDRNFEFFIRGLARDERAALIRGQQRLIKQAVSQFVAPSDAAAAPPPAPEEPLASAPAQPLTTHGPAAAEAPDAPAPAEAPLASPRPAASSGGPGSGVAYLTLLLSLGSCAGVLYVAARLLAEQRQLRARVRELETELSYYADPNAEPEPPAEPTPGPARSLLSRLRPRPTDELPADDYGDERG